MKTSSRIGDGNGPEIFWVEGEEGRVRDAAPEPEPEPEPEPAVSESFGIAELAGEFGVTLRALRFYESKGLLAPRRAGKDRLYSRSDKERIALILKGKKLGFTLTEIRQMIAGHEGRATAQNLRMSQKRCREQITHLERQLADVQEALNELRRIEFLLAQDQPATTV